MIRTYKICNPMVNQYLIHESQFYGRMETLAYQVLYICRFDKHDHIYINMDHGLLQFEP